MAFQVNTFRFALQALAEKILRCQGAKEFANMDWGEADTWLRAHSPISSSYMDFLDTFKFRCFKEVILSVDVVASGLEVLHLLTSQFDFTSTPWGENPEPLVRTLQAMVMSKLGQTRDVDSGTDSDVHLPLEERLQTIRTPLKVGTR